MFALSTRKLSTTLFISLAILVAVANVAEASHDAPLQQRDHVNLKRIVRKRAPQEVPGPVIGAAPIPSGESSSAASTSASASTTTSGLPSVSISISTGAPTNTTSATDSTTSGVSTTDTTSTDTTSTTESTTSTTSSTSTTTTPSTTAPATTAPPQNTDQVTSTAITNVKSTKTIVTSVQASETTVPQLSSAAAKTSSNIITILIAVAASIGGVAILWTIFRKWKLGSSKRFEERLQPIDWKSPAHGDDDGLPGPHRRHSGASFQSSSRNNGLSPIPDHDFTATGNVSPVGGYADMSRGPSPPMRENNGYAFGSGIGNSGRY